MKIAAAYIRVSTDDQLELSPDSQIKLIRDYAKRNDMIIPNDFVFADEGISGKETTKRPAFNAMIGKAKQKPKPFECILVWKFSRFARSREDSILYKSMLRKQLGIDVVSISENIGDDKMSILVEALIEAMDEYYSINLAEEVKRGMTEKVERGGVVASPSFGYGIRDKQYYINPETSIIVKEIFDDFVSGVGCREIAVKLNDRGIKTSRGNNFENRTVEYILCNPVYIGKIRWNPTERTRRDYDHPDIMLVDGSHEHIISDELWEQAQSRMAAVKKQYSKYTRTIDPGNEFMLHGIVKCSNCGKSLSRSRFDSLQCQSYAKGTCKVSHYANIEKLSRYVLEGIELAFTTGNFELITKSKAKAINNTDLLLQKEYVKLNRVKEAYQDGIDTLSEYKINKEKILETIKHLTAAMPVVSQKSQAQEKKEFIEKHRASLITLKDETIPGVEKNKLLRSFVDKIIFDRTKNCVEIFYYQ